MWHDLIKRIDSDAALPRAALAPGGFCPSSCKPPGAYLYTAPASDRVGIDLFEQFLSAHGRDTPALDPHH